MEKKVVDVAVGVIKRADSIFITKRDESQHQGGLWEFPGGKIETGESVFEALKRELKEEVGIDIVSSQPLLDIEHDYGDKCVKLHIHIVDAFTGEASGLEGQASQWVKIDQLQQWSFPAANTPIIEKLQKS